MTKRILFLGGAPTQTPPIKYALEQGYYVITCDYLPENPGHKLAHEYYDISTTDKDAVLTLAQELKIDGIVAYASDPAAPTAAYVAEKMGLPGNPYAAVEVLARKDYFRTFLADNGFNVPRSESFYELEKARNWLNEIGVPAFIKPIDSSGSKGVTRIEEHKDFDSAFEHALSFSREKKVVAEQVIPRSGYQIDSDIFMSNGKIAFWLWGDQHQDTLCHPYAPIAISFPSVLDSELQQKAKNQVESVLTKLGFQTGAFNVEFVVDTNGEVWIIEIGPRNGGNLIPQVIKYASGVDTIAATVDEAVGIKFDEKDDYSLNGYWSSYIVHAREDGLFKELWLSDRVKPYIVEQDIHVKPGDSVSKFSGSHDTLGTMIIKFPSMQKMLNMLDNMENDILVLVE
ncbi:ATP-grasp domain-containing protein [Psychrobacter sp. H8-1]|uniref:ATP-grasp domain-containing protein n=1 Tax=Psychrobacter sp. H8-1 TaxID=2774129 RepID=UPI001919C119|nr:ATP-grasp domain-containing protein [Psychrobacter sp. H8-1]